MQSHKTTENIKDGHLSTEGFQKGHVKHGEIEHTGHIHETHHREVGEIKHKKSKKSKKHSGEKHIYHEREVLHGGDVYREGVDPTLTREIAAEVRHEGAVKREVVGEAKVIKEKIKEVELHKVQPVIHRDREQKEIRHVVQPHQEFEVKDTKISHREKDIDLGTRREASTLETSRSAGMPTIEASREFMGTELKHQELPMRVEERVHKKIEEHIHPVIYKETLVPTVKEETHHLYETVKEAPIETYEVKNVKTHSGMDMREAERAFFAEHTSRGIDVDMNRSLEHHTHTHTHGTTCNHGTSLATEPIVGHHQNIGAHHVAGAVPAGHNTAYDAALCNQCTDNKICSHGDKDKELMHKMNDKKLDQDKKLKSKEKKKLRKSGDKHHKSHKNVSVV